MAGSKSNFLETRVVNTVIGKSTTLVAPSTMWIALLTITGTDAWIPTDTGEVPKATTNYVRFKFTNSTASNWTKATVGSLQNKAVFTFTPATGAGGTWGTVKSMAIVDSSSTASGNNWYWGDLTANQTISVGNTVRFTTGSIVITED